MEIVPKRKWRYPMAVEREYAKYLTAYVGKEMDIIKSFLPEMADAVWRNRVKKDSDEDEEEPLEKEPDPDDDDDILEYSLLLFWLLNLLSKMERRIKQKLTIAPVVTRIFSQVFNRASQEMADAMESVFGSKPTKPSAKEIEKLKAIWVNENLELVKSIDKQTMNKIRMAMTQSVIRAVDKKQTMAELADEIQAIAKVERKRAILIATDQVGKLNGQLTQFLQTSAGIEEYIWNTMKDGRVRAEHEAREGKPFKWTEPPADGHPGYAINCRCTALPVFDTDKMRTAPKPGSYTVIST